MFEKDKFWVFFMSGLILLIATCFIVHFGGSQFAAYAVLTAMFGGAFFLIAGDIWGRGTPGSIMNIAGGRMTYVEHREEMITGHTRTYIYFLRDEDGDYYFASGEKLLPDCFMRDSVGNFHEMYSPKKCQSDDPADIVRPGFSR